MQRDASPVVDGGVTAVDGARRSVPPHYGGRSEVALTTKRASTDVTGGEACAQTSSASLVTPVLRVRALRRPPGGRRAPDAPTKHSVASAESTVVAGVTVLESVAPVSLIATTTVGAIPASAAAEAKDACAVLVLASQTDPGSSVAAADAPATVPAPTPAPSTVAPVGVASALSASAVTNSNPPTTANAAPSSDTNGAAPLPNVIALTDSAHDAQLVCSVERPDGSMLGATLPAEWLVSVAVVAQARPFQPISFGAIRRVDYCLPFCSTSQRPYSTLPSARRSFCTVDQLQSVAGYVVDQVCCY